MYSLAALNDLFSSMAGALWPGPSRQVAFLPSGDLAYGDLSSGSCLELADELGTAPEEVARALVSRLPADFPFRADVVRGFINLTGPNAAAWLTGKEHPPALTASSRWSIIVAPPSRAVPPWGYRRLLAAAIMQAGALASFGIHSVVHIADARTFAVRSRADLFAAAAAAVRGVDQAASGPDQTAQLIEQLLAQAAQPFLWLAPDSVSRAQLARLLARGVPLHCPPKSWVTGIADGLGAGDVERICSNDELLCAALLYLTGEHKGRDLDLAVPFLSERSNLAWFLAASLQRLQRLHSIDRGGDSAGYRISEDRRVELTSVRRELPTNELCEVSFQARAVLIRCKFLDHFLYRAAAAGEVRELVSVFADFLRRLNVVLNTPDFRARWDREAARWEEREIVAGASRALSNIIEQWLLLSSKPDIEHQ